MLLAITRRCLLMLKVFIDVEEVVIKYNGNQEDRVLGIEGGVYDLLELTAGVNVLLYNDEVPAGDISQIRLILGEENSIVVDGEVLPLDTPSAQQSGLKIQVHQTLEAGVLYEFILDFDVDKSIVAQGNGGYSLKPVIRATTTADRKSTRLNSSHVRIPYAVFCLKKQNAVEGGQQGLDLALSPVQFLGDQQPVGHVLRAERERSDAAVRLPFRPAAPQVGRDARGG